MEASGMADPTEGGLRERLARQGEDALGKLAQDLLENPLVNSAISRAFDARERAVQAQEAALGALNLPSAADVERLTRRLRSVSQRMEGIEEAVDRLDQRLAAVATTAGLDERLTAIENQLGTLVMELSQLSDGPQPLPREQERLAVDEATKSAPALTIGRFDPFVAFLAFRRFVTLHLFRGFGRLGPWRIETSAEEALGEGGRRGAAELGLGGLERVPLDAAALAGGEDVADREHRRGRGAVRRGDGEQR